MTTTDTNPVLEVRRNRELLLEKYGGIGGLHQHMDTERQKLESQGWKFASVEGIQTSRREVQELRA
jgi:hypothetical protein